MKLIAFLVLVLAAIASAQIPLYSDSHGIYGPYGTYGPYSRNGVYGRNGIYGPVGVYDQPINPSIYHIAHSFFSKIQRRVETAYISPDQVPRANDILSEAVNNFKTCESEYIIVPNIPSYKRCLQTFVNKASVEISMLEGNNKPTNLYDRILYPKALDGIETRGQDNANSIKTSTEIQD